MGDTNMCYPTHSKRDKRRLKDIMIKFKNSIEEYSYIVGFDLAMYHTGVCVYDISEKKMVQAKKIEVAKKSEQPIVDLYIEITKCLNDIRQQFEGKIFVTKEALPQQAGKFTQISTLQGLAKAHAILDLCIHQNEGIDTYDYTGVHSISVKAVFRTENLPKPQKQDIASALGKIYQLEVSSLTEDITDAMGVVHTLITKKWNNDIVEEVKNIKKEIKKLKAENAILLRQEKIEHLLNIKI